MLLLKSVITTVLEYKAGLTLKIKCICVSAGRYTGIFSNQWYQCDTDIDTGSFLRYRNTAFNFFIDNRGFFEIMAEVELVEKKGTTLYVWTFFRLKKGHSQDSEQVICRLCRNSVIARGGNTSNLFSHLRNHHPKEHADASKAKTLKVKRKMNDN